MVGHKSYRVAGTMNKAQIWATLQAHTPEQSETVNYSRRQAPYVFDKIEDSIWCLVNDWQDTCDDLIKQADTLNAGPASKRAQNHYEFVTFHQAYSYEDFVEGIRPVQDEESGELVYRVVPGVFRRLCQRAKNDSQNRYALFIDEINRGNIAKIFGELITLIERDKRAEYDDNGDISNTGKGMALTLPYSGELFSVPKNVDIFATMNTADRSIALLDTALRRRFTFKETLPDSGIITGSKGDGYIDDGEGGSINLRELLDVMNRRIRFLLNRDLMLGHAYLCKVKDFSGLKDVLLNQLIPLLQEYFYNDWHRLQLVFADVGPNSEKLEPQIIEHHIVSEMDVLGFDHDDFDDLVEYNVAHSSVITPDSVRKIYEGPA
jgi:5-methylcytosine-specific restriction enzyme B